MNLDDIIDGCIERAKGIGELGAGYTACQDVATKEITYVKCNDLVWGTVLKKELKRSIEHYLFVKEAGFENKVVQAKCDAYELALTRSRPVERIGEEQ